MAVHGCDPQQRGEQRQEDAWGLLPSQPSSRNSRLQVSERPCHRAKQRVRGQGTSRPPLAYTGVRAPKRTHRHARMHMYTCMRTKRKETSEVTATGGSCLQILAPEEAEAGGLLPIQAQPGLHSEYQTCEEMRRRKKREWGGGGRRVSK